MAFQSQFVTGAGRAILIKKESLRKACALLEEREPDNMHLVTPSPTKNEEGYPQFVVTVKRVFNRVHYLESITGFVSSVALDGLKKGSNSSGEEELSNQTGSTPFFETSQSYASSSNSYRSSQFSAAKDATCIEGVCQESGTSLMIMIWSSFGLTEMNAGHTYEIRNFTTFPKDGYMELLAGPESKVTERVALEISSTPPSSYTIAQVLERSGARGSVDMVVKIKQILEQQSILVVCDKTGAEMAIAFTQPLELTGLRSLSLVAGSVVAITNLSIEIPLSKLQNTLFSSHLTTYFFKSESVPEHLVADFELMLCAEMAWIDMELGSWSSLSDSSGKRSRSPSHDERPTKYSNRN